MRKILKISLFIFFCLSIFFILHKYTFGTDGTECDYCCPPACPGGLVPCGRSCDDPTTEIVESAPCTLCHLFVLFKRIVDFLTVNVVFPLTVLMFVVGGVIFLTAAGSPERITQGRNILTTAAIGLIIMLIAWLIVNTVLVSTTTGHLPRPGEVGTILGKPWNKIECPVVKISEFTCCGDGIVQRPNFYGFNEQCEKNESFAAFQARGTDDLDGDGDVDMIDYTIMKNVCTFKCTLGCINDPLFDEVGKGCYLEEVECQKGKYVCDTTEDKVICADVYGDPNWGGTPGNEIYDYCCRATEDPNYTLANAQADLAAISWQRVKPYAADHGTSAAINAGYPGEYKCDEICRSLGKICVGTIIDKNDIATACYGVRCHTGANCTLDANMARIDCRLTYPFTRRDASSANKCTIPETYYVGYTSCLCK